MRTWRARIAGLAAGLVASMPAAPALAHGDAHHAQRIRGTELVAWTAPNVSRVLTGGYPDSFGLSAFFNRRPTVVETIEGKKCVTGNFLALDVDDHFAHDIDETVTLKLHLYRRNGARIYFAYDKSDEADPLGLIEAPDPGAGAWQDVTIKLDRARFAGRGMNGTDISLVAEGTFVPGKESEPSAFTLCGLEIARSFEAPKRLPRVPVEFRIVDETGSPVSARVGLYDASGRDVIPGSDALAFQFYDENLRQTKLRSAYGQAQPWPHRNRYIFYVDGAYRDKLSPGVYTLIVAKGPEYRWAVSAFSVPEHGVPEPVVVRLERAIDMPARGWFSGDGHVHLARNRRDNDHILSFLKAEDIHLSNLLRADNIGARHYEQYAYGPGGRFGDGRHAIAPGVEGPRTAQLGHVIALNPTRALYDPRTYFLYHRQLQAYHAQGALTGYAHVGADEFRASSGLALDAPLGHVDFVEVLQNGRLGTELWYELLDLGYKVAPTAGSDFPYYDQPGAVRNYVSLDGAFSIDSWFDGLRAGRTFVTNGPMLQFSVQGRPPGSHVSVPKGGTLSIEASGWLNPDLGMLRSLEVVSCGKVVATRAIADGTVWQVAVPAAGSGWIALRAKGSNSTVAHTAPIYVDGGDGRSWCRDRVPGLTDRMLARLDALEKRDIDQFRELEYWDSNRIRARYAGQRGRLLAQIEKARAAYRKLRDEHALATDQPGAQ